MGRRYSKLFERLPDGPYPCYFRDDCGYLLPTKYDRHAIEGWEWFTGYGSGPVHFCPSCRRLRSAEIEEIRRALNIKPVGYPEVRAAIHTAGTGG